MDYTDVQRLEFKLDLILEALRANGLLLASTELIQARIQCAEMNAMECPACGKVPNYAQTGDNITRTCGCKPSITLVLISPEKENHVPEPRE